MNIKPKILYAIVDETGELYWSGSNHDRLFSVYHTRELAVAERRDLATSYPEHKYRIVRYRAEELK